jgi:replication initiation and membrane attachment protein
MLLKQRMIPVVKVLTESNRKLISEMMFLYDLAPHEVEKSVLWALTDENILDVDEFKLACHDLFKTKHNQTPIELTVKKQTEIKQEQNNKPKTKRDQLIQRLETISPKHLLEDLSSGNQASAQDMKIIREVMNSQGLPAPVMNVLIHYVLLQSNMKLSKAYLEKIASHWSRANLKTAREAMDFAQQEATKHQQGFTNNNNYRKQASTEIIPDWFNDRNKKQPEEVTEQYNPESEKEKEEIDALLRLYAGE